MIGLLNKELHHFLIPNFLIIGKKMLILFFQKNEVLFLLIIIRLEMCILYSLEAVLFVYLPQINQGITMGEMSKMVY